MGRQVDNWTEMRWTTGQAAGRRGWVGGRAGGKTDRWEGENKAGGGSMLRSET